VNDYKNWQIAFNLLKVDLEGEIFRHYWRHASKLFALFGTGDRNKDLEIVVGVLNDIKDEKLSLKLDELFKKDEERRKTINALEEKYNIKFKGRWRFMLPEPL